MAVWGTITPSLLTWVHLKPQPYCCAEAALLAVYDSVVFRKGKWEAGAALVKYCRWDRRSSPRPGGSTGCLTQHQVPMTAGVRAGWGLQAQLSIREHMNDVSQGRSTCSAGWAHSHPVSLIPQTQRWGGGVGCLGTSPAAQCSWSASIFCTRLWGYLQATLLQRCLKNLMMGFLTQLGWPSALQHSSPFHSHASVQETFPLVQGRGCLGWDEALILPAHHNKLSFCTLPLQCGTALGMPPWL